MSTGAGHCPACGSPLVAGRRYCSNACRQSAYRQRVAGVNNRVARPLAGNLPLAVDHFLGRGHELRAITALLGKHRLVSLVGAAGAGKSRLALEVAAKLEAGHPDGAWWVDLTAVERDDLVPQAVAARLGFAEHPDQPVVDVMAETLAGRDLMLVLDNCEHLLEGTARLVEALLRRCRFVRVLITSREPLLAHGERVFLLRELTLPDRELQLTKTSVLRSEAVALFVDRATATAPDFALTDGNAADVAALCTRLDGLPLAIELAARRVRLLPVHEMVARLDDRLQLLTVACRTADNRHGSLQAAIDWSYDLLKPTEQAAWRRLAILPGTFDLDIAVAVYGEASPAEMLELLASLEAKSLLVVIHGPAGAARFRQLESIRLYGRQRLGETSELHETSERLVAWLAGLVDAVVDRSYVMFTVLPRLGDNWTTLLAAVEHTVKTGDPRYAPVAFVLAAYWLNHGRTLDAESLVNCVLLAGPPDRYRGLLLGVLAYRAHARGDFAEALRLADEAIALERTLDGPARLARALLIAAISEADLGRFTPALQHFDECVGLLRTLEQPQALAMALNSHAWAALRAGDVDLASLMIDECLSIINQDGSPVVASGTLHTAGVIALTRADVDLAEGYFAEAVRVGPDTHRGVAMALHGLGVVAVAKGDPERAVRLIEAGIVIAAAIKETNGPYWQAQVDKAFATAATQLAPAQLRAAQATARRMDLARAVDYALDTTNRRPPADQEDGRLLTARERDIAALVTVGLTNAQIARRLGVSSATVATHLTRILSKLDVRTRAQLAAWMSKTST